MGLNIYSATEVQKANHEGRRLFATVSEPFTPKYGDDDSLRGLNIHDTRANAGGITFKARTNVGGELFLFAQGKELELVPQTSNGDLKSWVVSLSKPGSGIIYSKDLDEQNTGPAGLYTLGTLELCKFVGNQPLIKTQIRSVIGKSTLSPEELTAGVTF
jgi:hypothetical protein